MNWKRWVWPGVLIFSTLGLLLAAFLKWPAPLRTALTLWFCVICPGMAIQRVFGLRLPVSGWVLAIAFSLAIDTAVGLALLYSGNWSWKTGLMILAGLTIVCTFIEMFIPQAPNKQPAIVVTSLPARTKKPKSSTKTEQG